MFTNKNKLLLSKKKKGELAYKSLSDSSENSLNNLYHFSKNDFFSFTIRVLGVRYVIL